MEGPSVKDCGVSSRAERKAQERAQILIRENQRKTFKLVSKILKKSELERTAEDAAVLQRHQDTVTELCKRQVRRSTLKRKQEEVFDSAEDLQRKVRDLADAVRHAEHLVLYTGAGISTAASIPDYRGPQGVWTQLQKGRAVSASDLSEAEPTLTHMCIRALHQEKLVRDRLHHTQRPATSHSEICYITLRDRLHHTQRPSGLTVLFVHVQLRHIVSQNCDGLHLRSGLPRHALSELHGNMFIEVCVACSPAREYVRLFDVTERTGLHRHGTGRRCTHCGGELRDTIVHFGERGTLEQPLNWSGASEAAGRADVILCLGSSLKVLKKYTCLWCMNRPPSRRPKLYIVNLQWTPKDDLATLKIHGKCDDVMKLLMKELNLPIPEYDKAEDPIFTLATPLRPEEESSHTRKVITPPSEQEEFLPGSKGQAGGTAVQGGWFGRGYSKGRKKRKSLT